MCFCVTSQATGHTACCPQNPWRGESWLWCMFRTRSLYWANYPGHISNRALNNYTVFFNCSVLGYSQKKDGERSSGAADSDWGSLWAEEERGRGTDWAQRKDCNTFINRLEIQQWLVGITVIEDLCVNGRLKCFWPLQESRRAERAEQQRVRAEKERDRQTRIAVIHAERCITYVWYTSEQP